MNARELANSICRTLQERGYEALLAGGCVRDILLKREPADYDVATNATPEMVMQIFPESLAVGARFGVVLIPHEGHKVEVATFRSDASYSDGRHPDRVVYSPSAREDVQRRDFTINGMMMRHDTGEVLDFVGGHRDLQAGIVRAIGDPACRFAEDKLRMLRAVRFSARFAFPIEKNTFAAIRAASDQIVQVSPERIREELTRLLTEGAARRAFELLDETDLLQAVLPEVAAMKGVQQPPEFHPEGDVWIHTRMMLERLPAGVSATLAWGVLLHDVGKPATFKPAAETGDRIRFDGHVEAGVELAAQICERLRFSTEAAEQIVALVCNHMRFKDVSQMKAATLKRFVRLPDFSEHLELHRLDCLASHGRLDAYQFVRHFAEETPPEQIRPTRLLTGYDLLAMGVKPGPVLGMLLRALEEAQLNDEVRTPEAARSFAEAYLAKAGGHE
jgi:poly(A) polymerase